MNKREILRQEIIPDNAAKGRAVARRNAASRLFKFGRPQMIGVCIDEIAGETYAVDNASEIGAIDIAGQLQSQLLLIVLLAIAREAVGAERKGKRGERGIVSGIGKAVGACGQKRGKRTRAEKVLGFLVPLDCKKDGRKRTLLGGQKKVTPSYRFEPRGFGKGARARVEFPAGFRPRASVDKDDRNTGRSLPACDKNSMHCAKRPWSMIPRSGASLPQDGHAQI